MTCTYYTLVLLFIGAASVSGAHYNLDYSCNTDGNVFVVNPDTDVFKSATAADAVTGELCATMITVDLQNINITGCNKTEEIAFTLSSRSGNATGDGVIGGSYTETYVILCQEIQMEGIVFTATVGMGVIQENSAIQLFDPVIATQPAVTPSFDITTAMRNAADTETVTSANVGDILRWVISGPYEYDLQPVTCTVYAGTSVGGSPQKNIINNGCTVNDELLEDFASTSSDVTKLGEIFSQFYAFRYYNSEDITLACTVRICTRGSTSCAQSCSKRRRRQYTEQSYDSGLVSETVVAHLRIAISGAETLGCSAVIILVSAFLTVPLY